MNEAFKVPPSLRVLIVEDDTFVGMAMRGALEKAGHVVVGQAARPSEAAAIYRDQRPDLVLLDICLADNSDGLAVAEELMAIRRCPMIIVSAYSDGAMIERAGMAGVFGYLIKPVSDRSLQAQIEVAIRRFAEAEELRDVNERLIQHQETRRLVERAKAILMKRAGLAEDDAHRRLQQESQKRRMNLADLCRRIIESDEVMR